MNDLKIIHFNTQGFKNKVDNINHFVRVHKPDVLVVTEHFQKSAKDLEQIDGYRIVNSFCRQHNERGGVAIWARENIPCRPRRDLDRHRKESELELVSVSVGEEVVITGAYRPPSTSLPEFHVHLERLLRKINQEPHIKHVLAGDFNIDNSKPNRTRTVLSEHDLMFHITSGTHRHGHCIDNFITNFDTSRTRVIKSKSSEFSDHHPIELIIDKEATSIAKRSDSYLYKLFQKVFEKKNDELRKESLGKTKPGEKENQKFRPQSGLYGMFSDIMTKRTSADNATAGSKKKTASKRKQKSSKKSKKKTKRMPTEKKKLDDVQKEESADLVSKVFTWVYSWFISAPEEKQTVSPELPRKKYKKCRDNNSNVLSVERPSILSKIFRYIFSVFPLFRSSPSDCSEPDLKSSKSKQRSTLQDQNYTTSPSFFNRLLSFIF